MRRSAAMSTPILFLTVGLPGCGKTTAARQFEAENAALRLTKDEWMKALYGAANPSTASDVIEGRLIAVALRVLTLGANVALDFGLWSRDERSALRHAGHQAGASVVLWYAPIALEERAKTPRLSLGNQPGDDMANLTRGTHEMGRNVRRADPRRARRDGVNRPSTGRLCFLAGMDAAAVASKRRMT